MLFVAKQHEMRMRHAVIGGLAVYATFFVHYLINGATFGGKKLLNIKRVF
jgi:hypothetical protein